MKGQLASAGDSLVRSPNIKGKLLDIRKKDVKIRRVKVSGQPAVYMSVLATLFLKGSRPKPSHEEGEPSDGKRVGGTDFACNGSDRADRPQFTLEKRTMQRGKKTDSTTTAG